MHRDRDRLSQHTLQAVHLLSEAPVRARPVEESLLGLRQLALSVRIVGPASRLLSFVSSAGSTPPVRRHACARDTSWTISVLASDGTLGPICINGSKGMRRPIPDPPMLSRHVTYPGWQAEQIRLWNSSALMMLTMHRWSAGGVNQYPPQHMLHCLLHELCQRGKVLVLIIAF